MNFVIAGNFPFPSGAASSVRIRNMALGLQACGQQVHILATSPTVSTKDEEKAQSFNGIIYETLAQISPGSGKLIRGAARYQAVIQANQIIHHLISKHECDVLIVYDRGISRVPLLLRGLSKYPELVKILDVVEYYQTGELFGSYPQYLDYWLGERSIHGLFDGFTVITSTLMALYLQRGLRNVLTFPHVEQWENLPKREYLKKVNAPFVFTYVGALTVRDNPESLYLIMEHLVKKGLNIQLNLIGYFERSTYGRKMAQKFQQDPLLAGRVNLLGAVSDGALLEYLQQSDGLILTRRNASSEIYAFPTRLLEYLQQARPVFAASVGDIPHYLRDTEDAILFDADDTLRAAKTIANAIDHPEQLHQIGINGYRRGSQVFAREEYAGKLLTFIEAIQKFKSRHQMIRGS